MARKRPIIKIIIKATSKVAMGHQPHTTGSGAHKDKRSKRNHTRSDQARSWKKDWD